MKALHKIFNQVAVAISKSDIKSAEKLLKSAERMFPKHPYVSFQKGMIEQLKGSDRQTVVFPLWFNVSKQLKDDADFLHVYGVLLYELCQYAPALSALGECVRLNKKNVHALNIIANIFTNTGNPVSATDTYKMILKIKPDEASAYTNMGSTLMISGFQEESVAAYKKALELKTGNNRLAASNYFFYSNNIIMSREEHFAFYEKYRTFYEPQELNARPEFPKTDKIRVGFASADFRGHSVAFFIKALFECYDRDRFEFHCFSLVDLPDSNTKMFQEFATKWHDIRKLSYVEVAQLVRDEQITAFVDLSAHSSGNILPVFGIRPAPVQITYCGFPNTTGLKSIDYRITDDICEPSDAEKFHTEKLYKIDGCFLCFTIGDDLPDTNFEPLNDRPIIFGSFNNLSKMTDKTIKLWVEAVNSVANAKFAIKHKYLNDPVLRKLTLEKFEKHGLSADKIVIFEFGKSTNEHLEIYNKIDIALDSFPYNGTTTTCEALYMGVPVITILGDRHVSRVSASLLTAVGLPELVAKDENEFVEISAELARNIEKLTEIKKNLRNNMKNSILMNKKDFTGRFQNAILNMIDEVKKEGS